ncbi:MAG: GxxExxY protein [Bacteroidetes bacterium]|nr:GxxExxY protein [Bacteroidota bacterium]
MKSENYKHSEITELIIGSFFKVYNSLGYGFLEKVYENAMLEELKRDGLKVEAQHPIKVFYQDKEVGSYYADLLVEGKVIVELKAAEYIAEEHEAQLLNYLRATDIEVGLLLNFGKEARFKKKVFSNGYKNHHQS